MIETPRLVGDVIDAHAYPLVFATISGAHLYGFASADSDFDIRGVHVVPLRELAGLDPPDETVERMLDGPPEIDLVTHEAAKFFRLLLRPNGYVLEQLLSPHVMRTSSEHAELVSLAPRCITRRHVRHYLGFAQSQWRLFTKESPPRVKPLLYTFRVLLTGIHLMNTGQLDANLSSLNETARLVYLPELIERKQNGREKERLTDTEVTHYEREYQRLLSALIAAGEQSTLPEEPSCRAELGDLLLRLRGLAPTG